MTVGNKDLDLVPVGQTQDVPEPHASGAALKVAG